MLNVSASAIVAVVKVKTDSIKASNIGIVLTGLV
jgi:hypothetical protein